MNPYNSFEKWMKGNVSVSEDTRDAFLAGCMSAYYHGGDGDCIDWILYTSNRDNNCQICQRLIEFFGEEEL